MLQIRHLLVIFLWITNAGNVSLHTNGNRKLDMQFDNITYMDLLSRRAMRKMHDELDNDDDGNVSISEGVKFFAGHKDLLENTGANANLPGFVTDIDGRITEAEFWDSWIQSDVHNWTNTEMLSWLKYECELPQYSSNFHTLNVTGAAFPILACNSTIVSVLVDGSKENRMKLMLKAKEVVLFGPPKQKGNFVKDALLTFSLALALGGIAFGMHVQRKARDTIENIEEKMLALQKTMDRMEEESAIDMIPVGPIPQEMDERSGGSNSGESEDSLTSASMMDETIASSKLAEVMRELDATKEALRNAGKVPSELVKLLKTTHQVESKLFQMKKDKVYKDVEQTKTQFQKIERNRSSLLGILQVVHGRQMDSFDFQVQQTRDEFRELQSIMEERRKRWGRIEQLCKFRIKSSNTKGDTMKSRSSKMSVDKDILSNLDSMSVTSSSSNIDKSLSMMQKHRTNKTKRTSLPSTTDDEERDVVSLQDFTMLNQKKSPTSSKKFGTMPSHMSSPALTSKVNGVSTHGHKDRSHEPKKIPHSESTGQLETSLKIPETANQTFPKRSPHNIRKRGPLPESMIKNGDSEPIIPKGSPSLSASGHIPKSKSQISSITNSENLTPSKRSVSAASLQNFKTKQHSDDDLSPTNAPSLIVEEAVHKNGSTNNLESSPLSKSPQSVEKARKSNFFKRAFYKKKQK